MMVALVAVAEARRASGPPRLTPFERNCREAETWEQQQLCIDTHEKGAKVSTLAPDVKQVSTTGAREYLFLKLADRWRMVYRPGDANYELVTAGEMRLGKQPARRIELSHHVPLGTTGVFIERVTLVCPAAGNACQAFVTACTVIRRGRAVETFRGELEETDGVLTLVGDRTHSGLTCRGR